MGSLLAAVDLMLISSLLLVVLIAAIALISAVHSAVSTIRGSAAVTTEVECESLEEQENARRKRERLLVSLRLAWGLTFAAILSVALGEPQRELAWLLSSLLGENGRVDSVSYTVTAVVTVLVILILGDILPGYIGALHPEQIASRFTRPMSVALRLLGPIPRSIQRLMHLVGRKGAADSNVAGASEEDIRHLVHEVHEAGVIQEGEREIIDRVFKLADKPIASVMTPRNDVTALQLTQPFNTLLALAVQSGHSCFPVISPQDGEVLGTVTLKDIVACSQLGANTGCDLSRVVEAPIVCPESMKALQLLELLRQKGARMAVVVDEYGSYVGIATLTDVMEVLVGELDSEREPGRRVVERSDGSLLVDSVTDVDELFEEIGVRKREEQSRKSFHSLGGFVMTSLGHVPVEGESFEAFGFRFEVVDMDGNRIDKVLVSQIVPRRAVGL